MKVAVIGGSGFIGSVLVGLIKDSMDVIIIDKNRSEVYPDLWQKGDVRNFDEMKSGLKGIDIVVNLAAEHRDDVSPKSLYTDVNVTGAKHVCDACDFWGIKNIIFTSSVAIYGEVKKETDETGEFNYFNDYGKTKKEAEDVYFAWQKGSDKKLIIIRPSVVFGPNNRGNVYNLLKQIATSFFPMVGSGKNIKSMVYVENVAAFLAFCLDEKNFDKGVHIFNYVDKPDYDMNHLVAKCNGAMGKKEKVGFHWPYFLVYFGGLCFDLLAKILRRKFPISSIRVKKFCMSSHFTSSRIAATGFVAPFTLNDGLKKTIEYEFLNK